MDQFEVFFRRADLDGDGRISGAEAVAFFQGTTLPKPVLAQIWTHADQSRTGYLGRQEFFNALKLVTVAQSKRDLTPDIVKAALYGPAAAKIPPPQINLAAIPGNQASPVAAAGAPRPQMGAATQGPGFRGPGVPDMNMNNQVNPMAAAGASRPQMGAATQGPGFRGPGVPGMNMNNQVNPMAATDAPRPQMGAATQGPGFRGPGVPGINMNNQVNPMAAAGAPRPQMGAATQGPGFRGPGIPSMNTNNQYYNPSQQSQMMRPAQPHSSIPHGPASHPHQGVGMMGQGQTMQQASTVSRPPQFMPGGATTGFGADWLGGRSGGTMVGPRGATPSTSSAASLPQNQALASSQPQNLALVPSQPHNQSSSQPAANDSKALVVSGSGSTNDSFFGGDVFSATPKTKQEQPPVLSYSSTSGGQPPLKSNSLDSLLSAMNKPATSTTVPTSSGVQQVNKSNSLDSLQSAYAMQPLSGQRERAQTLPSSGQQVSAPSSSSLPSSATLVGVGVGNNSDNSQILWPKMKPSDVQKYAKVFMEVDTDRDGRITGEEARNLFLSWRLPREILKQVWDLSDQDSDGMLSLREFCFSLYLMEIYREGRPLPAALPSTVMYDETLLSMTGQPKGSLGNAAWGPSPGHGHQPGMGTRQMGPGAGLRPPVPVTASQHNAANTQNQQKSRAPALDDSFLNQGGGGEQYSENSINQEDIGSEKKVEEAEKVILDSKEKIEYYRAKMQDLVLYKSRCDNRLNEITERAIADKREAELLGKKYEEKYKQVAEVTSKLTIEEATLRDIHERKRELHQAIVNMEQGRSADGILQVRADRIQSDLDELLKALTERSKKHGLEIKSAAMIELPIGWQPGIQDTAVIWDEDWDKFEDEGFSNDLSLDMKSVSDSKSATIQNERASADGSLIPDSLPNGDGKSRNFMSLTEDGHENESAYAHSEDGSARSPQDSPAGRAALESPSQAFSDVFAKTNEADTETHSFDESTWGAFDTNDDVDSVWGFNPSSNKGSESVNHGDFFGSDDFGVKPIRTGSTSTKSPFFEDSVAGSPVSRFGNSPRFSEAGDHLDNYSRFDSFSVNEGFSPREKLSRFDSINSTKDFGSHSRAFSSFDDTDPFGSNEPFKVSSEGQTSKKDSESWGNF